MAGSFLYNHLAGVRTGPVIRRRCPNACSLTPRYRWARLTAGEDVEKSQNGPAITGGGWPVLHDIGGDLLHLGRRESLP